ncbi:lyase family protein [Veillonella criceti]|uniref:argininosuccinate lyase n=1 Tax=Veillonella criceti TaxID=103891 RepID=A0A380NP60_9FIRM|nr:lyase family protein [Veillonella criceti]SUP44641.1 Argininosuccinate lyase [Veillonella criceti]
MKEDSVNNTIKTQWTFNPYNSSREPMVQAIDTDTEDVFFWIGEINKASLVINSNQGLLDRRLAKELAKGLQQVLAKGQRIDTRPQNVVDFEVLWVRESGSEVSRIHIGRSSQDMLTTANMAMLRTALLDLGKALLALNGILLELAIKHKATIVPAYTNGVAAQPTSYGHYLHAFFEGFSRDLDCLQAVYGRINRSPMGAMVLNGTGWPLDREAMAQYLGFRTLAYNCYDATQVYTLEYAVDLASITNSIAIHVGNFIADVMQQYAQPRPWIVLQEGLGNTYISSAMPQKRNPGLLNATRTKATTLLGEGYTAVMRAHNVPPGMADARGIDLVDLVQSAQLVVTLFSHCLQMLQVNETRALEELNLDWTASQEVADILMREYNIPFRIGHHVASDIVSYARMHQIKPLEFPYEAVIRIYTSIVETVNDIGLPAIFPMSEARFKEALNPIEIVQHRAVKGGPQMVEMEYMLQQSQVVLNNKVNWLKAETDILQKAREILQHDFQTVLNVE